MINPTESQKGLPTYMDAAETAEYLKVTKSWIQRYTRSGEIPCTKIGRRYFYTREAIDAWLESSAEAAA